MRQRIPVKRSTPAPRSRLLSTLLTYLPGAWIDPNNSELIALYRLRYRMALEEGKYDTAMIFLNKILELDPVNAEAKFSKGEIYHRCLHDDPKAIEHYNKVIRQNADEATRSRARDAMSEIMELLS